jgi:hypothetical protein
MPLFRVETAASWSIMRRAMVLQSVLVDPGISQQTPKGANLEVSICVNRHSEYHRISWLSVDVVAAMYSLEFPAVILKNLAESLSRNGLQSSTSTT